MPRNTLLRDILHSVSGMAMTKPNSRDRPVICKVMPMDLKNSGMYLGMTLKSKFTFSLLWPQCRARRLPAWLCLREMPISALRSFLH